MRTFFLILLCASAFGATTTNLIVSPNGKVQAFNAPFGDRDVVHTVGGNPVTITATTVLLNTTLYWVDGAPYVTSPTGGVELVSFALPDLSVTEPTTSYPVGFAAFSPTVTNTTPDANAPEIAEWTRQNDPGDTMALTAENLDADFAHFVYYSEAATAAGSIQRIDGRQAAVTLPDSLTADDFYLMWAMNTNGFGEAAGINQTEAWWIGPDLIATGEVFSIYGRNLDLGDGLAQAYIEGYGWITNNGSSNPYKVDFVVPSDLTNGTYTAYAHNGHGDKYGWGEALTFEVLDPIIWDPAHIYDVTDNPYSNATGDGVTDDHQAITNLLYNIRGYDFATLYFPAGTYMIGDIIKPNRHNRRYKGAGIDLTLLQATDDYAGSNDEVMLNLKSDCLVEDMELNKGDGTVEVVGTQAGTVCTRVYFNRIRSSCLSRGATGYNSGGNPLSITSGNHVYITDSEFLVGWAMDFGNAWQVFIDNCEFKGINDCNTIISSQGKEIAMINCTAGPLDDSDIVDGEGWLKGRWMNGGSMSHAYFADNVSSNMCARDPVQFGYYEYTGTVTAVTNVISDGATNSLQVTPSYPEIGPRARLYSVNHGISYGAYSLDRVNNWVHVKRASSTNLFEVGETVWMIDAVDQNSGEQFMWEGIFTRYEGYPEAGATSTVISFADLNSNENELLFTIVEGTGQGQSRRITDASTSGGVVTLERPLRVIPDETSFCKISDAVDRSVFFRNDLSGADRATNPEYNSATSGLNLYGASASCVVASNRFSKMAEGMSLWANSGDYAQTVTPNTFHFIKGNTIDNCQEGISHVVKDWDNDIAADVAFFGSVMRGNAISNSTREAFASSTTLGTLRKDLTIYDRNTAVSNAVLFGDVSENALYNQVYVNNTFTGNGSETGIVFTTTNSPALHNNTWTNVVQTYGGDVPGAVLEVPIRVFQVSTNAQTVTVQNSGTASMSYTSSLGDSGTIAAEQSDTFTFTSTNATTFEVRVSGVATQTIHVVEE